MKEKRIKLFRLFCGKFPTNKMAVLFIQSVLHVNAGTVMLWRSKKSMRPIPEKKFNLLKEAFYARKKKH